MGISLEDMEDASKYYEEQGDTQVLTDLFILATRASRQSTREMFCLVSPAYFCSSCAQYKDAYTSIKCVVTQQ